MLGLSLEEYREAISISCNWAHAKWGPLCLVLFSHKMVASGLETQRIGLLSWRRKGVAWNLSSISSFGK